MPVLGCPPGDLYPSGGGTVAGRARAGGSVKIAKQIHAPWLRFRLDPRLLDKFKGGPPNPYDPGEGPRQQRDLLASGKSYPN